MNEPDPRLPPLLEKLKTLEGDYPYSALLINVPGGEDSGKLFQELCELALHDPSGRERLLIKKAIDGKQGLLSCFLGYMYTAAEKMRETRDIHWLEIGLGAYILQDGYPDWRDTILAQAELYVTAEEVGLDPHPAFALIGYDEKEDFGNHPVVRERRGRHW
jgi:hypothetical protein